MNEIQLNLIEFMRKALVDRDRRQTVQIGPLLVRYLGRRPARDGRVAPDGAPAGLWATRMGSNRTWTFLGSSDDIEELLRPYVEPMTDQQVQKVHIDVGFEMALANEAEELGMPLAAADRAQIARYLVRDVSVVPSILPVGEAIEEPDGHAPGAHICQQAL